MHRWQRGVPGYLILFPILTFVPQRQSLVEKKLSPLVFPLGSKDLIPPLSIIQYNLYLILALIHLIFTKPYWFGYINYKIFKAAY